MNVQIEINGLGRVDFNSPTGWVRNPNIEICGVDDSDTCQENVTKYLKSFETVPFENLSVFDEHVDGAAEDIEEALRLYAERPGTEVSVVGTIMVYIRPVPKSSRDA